MILEIFECDGIVDRFSLECGPLRMSNELPHDIINVLFRMFNELPHEKLNVATKSWMEALAINTTVWSLDSITQSSSVLHHLNRVIRIWKCQTLVRNCSNTVRNINGWRCCFLGIKAFSIPFKCLFRIIELSSCLQLISEHVLFSALVFLLLLCLSLFFGRKF